MATGKRYYWIKLKESFMTSDTVDFLMGQPDGANYVVLYQMLCLKTINTDGKLERRIGEVIIPYDEQKIARDTKWFSVDTVRVALNLYKALGLIYVDTGGTLSLANFDNLVGSETDYAERNRRLRTQQQQIEPVQNVYSDVYGDVSENVYTDIDIDNRDKEKEIDTRDREKEKEKRKRFIAPTIEEVRAYCKERRNGIDAQHFVDYYTANGWKVGKNPMKDWKAAVRTWERNGNGKPQYNNRQETTIPAFTPKELKHDPYDLSDMVEWPPGSNQYRPSREVPKDDNGY